MTRYGTPLSSAPMSVTRTRFGLRSFAATFASRFLGLLSGRDPMPGPTFVDDMLRRVAAKWPLDRTPLKRRA